MHTSRAVALLALCGIGVNGAYAGTAGPGTRSSAAPPPAARAHTERVVGLRPISRKHAVSGIAATSGKATGAHPPAGHGAARVGTGPPGSATAQRPSLSRVPVRPLIGGPAKYDAKRGAMLGGPPVKPKR